MEKEIKEMSCTELAQELADKIHEKEYYSEEVQNNVMQLLKKIQEEEKELKNVPDREVEDVDMPDSDIPSTDDGDEDVEEEEDVEEFEKKSADDMKKSLGKKGVIVSLEMK